jgi:ABC-type dipeptide transport system, periplasmic component
MKKIDLRVWMRMCSFLTAFCLVGEASLAQAQAPASAVAAVGKTLSWGVGGDVDTMDVHVGGTVASWQIYQMIYETLLTTDKDMKLQPGLAESWQQTSPATYVLNLRKDARWSNGRPVVAADVIGSIQRITGAEMNPVGVAAAKTDAEKKNASNRIVSYWSRQFGDIKAMSAPDDHTVKIELQAPHTAFLASLAHITAAIIPIKELKDGTFDPTRQLLGSGPFMVSSYKPKESWTLVRNPYYWRKGYPKVDRLEVLVIPDDAARIAALRDGRIDYSEFSNPDIARLVAGDRNLAVTTQNTSNFYRLDVNALSPKSPFRDKRVREALSLAIDRDAIASIVFAGTAKPDYPVPRAFGKTACQDVDTYKLPRAARLDKAKKLIAATGKSSVDATIIAMAADPIYARIAQVVQQNAKTVGINLKILQLPTADALDRIFTKGDFDTALSWLAGYSDPSMVVAWWDPKVAIWNTTFQEYVPPLAVALKKLEATADGPDRDAQLSQVCRMIDDGSNMLALDNKVDFIVHRTDTMDIRLDPVTASSNTFQHVAEFASKR